MTAVDTARPSRPIVMRHLLRTQLVGLEFWLAGFFAVVLLVGIGIHLVLEVTGSVWSGAIQFLRWYAIGMGVYLTAVYLPLYLAHGRTRREIATGSAAFSFILAVWLGAGVLLGYALEAVLYRMIGWTDLLPDPHPVGSLAEIATTFAEQGVTFLVWLAVGALGGAAFYRSALLGLVAVPVGLALLAVPLAVNIIGDSGLSELLPTLTRIADGPPLAGIAAGLAAALLAMALTWPVIRDTPMRSSPA